MSFHNWLVFLHVIVVVSLTGSNTALMSWACITSGAPWSSATTEFTGIIDIKKSKPTSGSLSDCRASQYPVGWYYFCVMSPFLTIANKMRLLDYLNSAHLVVFFALRVHQNQSALFSY